MSSPKAGITGPSTGSATPKLYFFKTKWGTDLTTFEDFIKTLPDKGEGDRLVLPHLPYQGYQTKLTFTQATQVAKEPFIRYVEPVFALRSNDEFELHDDGMPPSRL